MGTGFGAGSTPLPNLTGFDAAAVAKALGIADIPPYQQNTQNSLAQMLKAVPPSPGIGGGPINVKTEIPGVAARPEYKDAHGNVIIPAREAQPARPVSNQWGYQADRLLRFTPQGGSIFPEFAPYPGGNAGQGPFPPPAAPPPAAPPPAAPPPAAPPPAAPPPPGAGPPINAVPNIGSNTGGGSNTAPIVRGPENEDWEKGQVIGPNESVRVYHLAPKTQERVRKTLYNYVATKNTPATDWFGQPINNTQFGSPSFPLTPDRMPSMREGESAAQYALRLGLSPNETSEYLAHLATGNG